MTQDGENQDARGTPANQKHIASLKRLLADLLIQSCKKGVYGKFALSWDVDNGTIQTIQEDASKRHR